MLIYLFLATLLGLSFTPTALLAQGELLRFRLLPKESQIITQISDPFGKAVNGEFTLREGEAQGQVIDLKGTGWVRLVIDAASYNSNLGLRDQDVQENYLEVKDYPLIIFTTTGIDDVREPRSPEEAWHLMIRGVLELHGVKRELRLPVKVTHQGRRVTAEGSTKISLNDFNISVPTLLFLFSSGNQAEVKFRFVAEQQGR
ncbi:MAG: YceI family protein [Candidatus Binatia bacterium]